MEHIVPGKLYAYDSAYNIDLISFECSEERGALRGFVKVFYGSTEVFPTEVYAKGHWLTANMITQDGIQKPVRLDFDEKSGVLHIDSSYILTDAGIAELQHKLKESIRIKEAEVANETAKLRNLCDLLEKGTTNHQLQMLNRC